MSGSNAFKRLPTRNGYALELPKMATEVRIERLRREHGELVGELTVECAMPGTKAPDGILSVADFNVSSLRARTERSRYLTARANIPDLDFGGILETFCQRVIVAEREGQPAIHLRDLARPGPDDDFDMDGVRLPRRHTSILFGDGGALKSYLALHWAALLRALGYVVLYADWEFSGEDHRDRLERLTGPDMPDGILYVRCERPMTAEADRLRQIVRDESVDYLIADSIAFGCDGPPESAEIAAGYFRALRQIGTGSLLVAHVTKGEGGDGKPFGSVYWFNGARSVWYVKRAETVADPGRVVVGLYNRKANLGPLAPAVGFEATFEPERTTFQRIGIAALAAADDELGRRLPLWQRMSALLKSGGALTVPEIAAELAASQSAIHKAVDRSRGLFVKFPDAAGISHVGVRERGAA